MLSRDDSMGWFLSVALLALISMSGCQTDIAHLELGDSAAPRRVLIAGTTSEFKQGIVDRLTERLGAQDYYVRLIGLDRLPETDHSAFGAVLLICEYRAGRIDRRVRRFVEQNPTDPNVIVFCTTGSENSTPRFGEPDVEVDVVSSASQQDLVGERADRLVDLIEERLGSPQADHTAFSTSNWLL